MTAEDLAKFRDTQPGRSVGSSAPLCPTCKGSRVDPDDPQKFMPCPPCDGTGRQTPVDPGRHQQSRSSVPGNILFRDPPNLDDYHQKLG
jgi:hypothetical protein